MNTGNKVVDEISQINFKGNIIPNTWYSHIKKRTSKGDFKTDLLAVTILSEIIYWYRAVEERDENTGKTIKYNKKFNHDKYQKWYASWADMFGVSKKQLRDSINNLIKLNLISREIRTIKTNQGGILTGVTFFEPIPETIKYINNVVSEKHEPLYKNKIPPLQNCQGGFSKLVGGFFKIGNPTEIPYETPFKNPFYCTVHNFSTEKSMTDGSVPYSRKDNFIGSTHNELKNSSFATLEAKIKENIFSDTLISDAQKVKKYTSAGTDVFYRRRHRSNVKFEKGEIPAALSIIEEGQLPEVVRNYINHEMSMFDTGGTKNFGTLPGQFLIEAAYQSPCFVHYCKMSEEQKKHELKVQDNEEAGSDKSLLELWRES